jgi:hypothetical protein
MEPASSELEYTRALARGIRSGERPRSDERRCNIVERSPLLASVAGRGSRRIRCNELRCARDAVLRELPWPRRERRDGRSHRAAFRQLRLWLMGPRGAGCRILCRLCRINGAYSFAIHGQMHPLCRGRLASGLRALGTRICDRGGSIGARLRFRSAFAFGGRIFHIRGQPTLARRHGTAWDVPRPR